MMRLTTLLLALAGVTTTGCVATVGGNECSSERCADDDEGSGSGSATARDCSDKDDIEMVTTSVTIRTASDFNSLPKGCWSLDATLKVEGPAIESLEKLGDLVDVNDLELIDTGLTKINTKQELKVWGSLTLSNNKKLTGLDNTRITKWTENSSFSVAYVIRNNAELTNINGLKYITTVDRELTFTNNPKLASIELSELTNIGGALTITNNGATTVGLADLTQVQSVEISSNPALTTVSGLRTTLILGSVTFRANPKLSTIGSMSSLTQIAGNLVVDDNDSLTDLVGLTSSMQRISGTVTITNNQVLAGLGQLSHLQQIGSTVSITNNPTLSSCKAVELDRCVSSGTVTISGNSGSTTNCSSWCQ